MTIRVKFECHGVSAWIEVDDNIKVVPVTIKCERNGVIIGITDIAVVIDEKGVIMLNKTGLE